MYTKIIFMALAFLCGASINAQKKTEEVSFWVAGVCGMCEKAIENAVDVKGVIMAEYNLETHQLRLIYKPNKVSVAQLHHLINEAGYDTEKSAATEEQYSRVHGCCKYRSLENH